MKANELRIGNWVKLWHFWGKRWTDVLQIRGDQIGWVSDNKTKFEPITLTEDWLLKFGFEDDNRSFYKIPVGGSILKINPDNGIVWIERDKNIFNNPCLVTYVHQLQNLYFALAGIELILKDKAT